MNAIILTNGMLHILNAKTAHGLLRGTSRFNILAVIDHENAGQDAGEVMDGRHLGIPVFATLEDFFQQNDKEVTTAVVGVALHGGYLPDDFKTLIKKALQHQLSVVCGLHTLLSDDPELAKTASKNGVKLIDIRKPRPAKDLHFWHGHIYQVKTPKLAVLGMDCAVGKRTTCRFLMESCRENGINAEMIYTGQTGWLQGYPYGFIFDATLNDFIGGEIEHAIVECDKNLKPDLILVEGQSALRNPSGPCGSELLLSGNIQTVILQHAPTRKCYDGAEEFDQFIPSVANEIALIKMYKADVIAVTLSKENAEEAFMQQYQKDLELELGIPVVRPLKEGMERILQTVRHHFNI